MTERGTVKPSLFGLKNTNRDFTQKETWGKNQFNSSFPASLCCFLSSKGQHANYLAMSADDNLSPSQISISDVFGIQPDHPDTYFAFESQHTPYQKFVVGSLPRIDLVIQKESTGECLAGLEVKLTALPDNVTCDSDEKLYGSEIVVRPDTIVYLACSIASRLPGLNDLLKSIDVSDWSEEYAVLDKIDVIVDAVESISVALTDTQNAFLLQPIWKTLGKSPELAEHCLDVFVWSNAGFTNFISQIASRNTNANSITRQTRTAIWLYKMLSDIKENKKFNHEKIIDNLSYNTRNDKAFASSGNVTNKYMYCPRLLKPIVKKTEIPEIILGGGQHLLSPERRFDAILFNSPGLFS